VRPADVCRQLLRALDAAEGRRRRRKRDTTPDSIGLELKRSILEETVRQDPDPDAYEGWLLQRCQQVQGANGPIIAMAVDVLSEWRLAQSSTVFRNWLLQGASSDDSDS
jgi:hypothetical protein